MATPEQVAQQNVELHASKCNCRLMRNNSGAYETPDGNYVRYGLGNISSRINKQLKSSDLIGITKVTITPEMVGKTVGVFTAIEVKAEGFKPKSTYNKNSREWAQENFNQFVRDMGGFSGFATTGEDLEQIINHYINWLNS